MADMPMYKSAYTGEQIDESIGRIVNKELDALADRAEAAAVVAEESAGEAARVVADAAEAEDARVAAESARVAAESDRVARDAAMTVWGAYDAGAAYVPLNKVAYAGASYVCIAPTTGNAPTDTAYWLMIADKGDTGGAGERGPKGDPATINGMAVLNIVDGEGTAVFVDAVAQTLRVDVLSAHAARILYFSLIGGQRVLTGERPTAPTTILPKTYFPANPGAWTEILTVTAAADIAEESTELAPGDRFAASIWLLSDMAQQGALVRIHAVDTRDGAVIGSATATVDLTSDGVSPIPVSFDDVYGVLREVSHGDIQTTISIMPKTYGIQVGLISNPPDEVSYINTNSTAGGGASRAQTFTAVIPADGWSATAPYVATVDIDGITAAMTPIVDVVLSETAETAQAQLDAWGKVGRIVTYDGGIAVSCYESKPTASIPVQLKVVP